MFQISAIINTLNEERNIGRCLESLTGVVDEIIVVDSFSTDRTKEICLSHKVKLIENKWPGYALQKNFAQKNASFNYILSLDADEALTSELGESIKKIKNADSENGHDVLPFIGSFKRLTNYCGTWIRYGGWYPDVKLRLYDRRECEWEGIIHEWLKHPPSKKSVELKGHCLHYTFYTISDHVKQVEKFTTLKAKENFEKGKKINGFQILFKPIFKFFRDYFFRLGFLDGYHGYVIARISAYAAFLKCIKLKELQNNSRPSS